MRIHLTSVFVDDQSRALEFYTQVLGFVKKTDIDLGEHRWLTVTSPAEPDGPELLLEPNANPAAATYQSSIHEQGIPAAMFAVEDVAQEYARLTALGVRFTGEPVAMPGVKIAVFDDTCGNLIQIAQAD